MKTKSQLEKKTMEVNAMTGPEKCDDKEHVLVQVKTFLETKDEKILLALLEHAGECKHCDDLLSQDDEFLMTIIYVKNFGDHDTPRQRRVFLSLLETMRGGADKSEI